MAHHDYFLAKPVEAGLLLAKLREYLSLEWLYDDASVPSFAADAAGGADGVPEIAPLPGRSPPVADLQRLQELARLGDIRAIERALDVIANDGEPYREFVTRLRAMADQYDMPGIADAIGRLLGKTSQDEAG